MGRGHFGPEDGTRGHYSLGDDPIMAQAATLWYFGMGRGYFGPEDGTRGHYSLGDDPIMAHLRGSERV